MEESTEGGAALDRVLGRLRDVGIEVCGGPPPETVEIRQVGFNDPLDDDPTPQALLLAPGVDGEDTDQVAALDRHAASRGAAAVVVRGGGAPHPTATCAVLRVDRALTWDRAFVLLAGAVDGVRVRLSGARPGRDDLFLLVDAVAALVDGHVMLLDAGHRVITFSASGTPDEWRRWTILGRGVPQEWERRFRQDGLYDRIAEPGAVVHLALPDAGFRPRRYAGIHVGGQQVGVLAVAEGTRPFDEGTDELLRRAARALALPMHRRLTDARRTAHEDVGLMTLLEGGPSGGTAALPGGGPGTARAVMAVGDRSQPEGSAAPAGGRFARVQLCLPPGIRVLATAEGSRDHALCEGDEAAVAAWLADPSWADRSGLTASPIAIGLSGPVSTADRLPRARAEAGRALDAVLTGRVPGPAAAYPGCWPTLVLEDLRPLLADADALEHGAAAALVAQDRASGSDLAPTLLAYLAARGDARGTAAALHMHPNTLRYRVRRARELVALDLDDPVQRVVVELQLRALLG